MAAVVVIRVTQSDGCGFEVTEAADERVLPSPRPAQEAAHLLLDAVGKALRQLGPEAALEIGTLPDLLRQFAGPGGAP